MNPSQPPESSPHAAAARAEIARLAEEARAADVAARQSAEDFAAQAERDLERFPIESFAPGSTLRRAAPEPVAVAPAVVAPPERVVVPLAPPSPQSPQTPARRQMPAWGLALAAGLVLAGGLMLRPLLFPSDDLLRDGPLRVTREGRLADTTGLSAELISALENVVRTRSAAALLGLGDPLRGGATADPSAGFVQLEPPPGATVETDQPEFRWRRTPGATGSIVRLEQSDGTLVAESPKLGETQDTWRPPAPLARGEIYRWSVQTLGPGKTSPTAVLKVLSAADLAALQQLRRTHGRSHLILAATYARLGLDAEARREIAELARQEPASALARDLAASLK